METFPLNVPLIAGSSVTNTITIRPATGATNLSITSGNSTGTINLNGATYIIFDGRPGGSGTTKQLSLVNTSTSGYTVQFINDATNNTIKYCNIKGVNTSTSEGVVLFSTTTGTSGNDNNSIDNCDIGAGASTPTNTIYSSGTITSTATFNSNNTISNCTIHDFFSASSDHNGIWLSDGSTDWTISGNSFYETASRTMTTNYVHWCAIRIQNYTPSGSLRSTNISSCNNTLITGNYIGGTAANAGGSALTFNTTSKGTLSCIVIYGGSGVANSIQGNTITNINFTTTAVSVNSLLFHADGNLNIGTITPNIIGSTSGTGSISFTYNVTGGTTSKTFSPIFLGGAIITIAGVPRPEAIVPGNVNFQNNTVGSITVNASDSCQLRIIDFEESLCTYNISNNTLGNSTAGNIINNTKQGIAGMTGFAGTPGATHIISNNVLQNFLENNASQANQIVGIQSIGDVNQATTGLYSITNNTLHDFVSISRMTPTYGTVILGIDARATTPGQVISDNTLYNFTSTDATIISRVRGILYTGGPSTGTNKISKNIIRNLKASSTTGGIIRGIDVQAGPFSVENNMIVLGYDASGTSLTNNLEMEGIYNGAGINSFYYNSVHITGTGVASGTFNSYAYYGNNASSKIIQNNLFINSRSNASGTAKNYGMVSANTSGLASDYNDIYVSGAGGVFGNNGSDQATLALWKTATGQDAHSISTAPGFVDAATDLHLTASPSTANFLINNQGIPVATVTADIDGDTRNLYTPDPGFDEFKGTGSWIGVTSTDWATSSNWDDNIIPTSSLDAKILNAPNMPLVTTNPESVHDLYITLPGTLTVNGGNLRIAGNIYNNATFDASAGSIEMNGTSAQSIPAGTFVSNALHDLIISNTSASGVTLGGALDIYGSLTYSGTGMKLTTNDNLTFKSTAAGTAWLGDMTGNTITGKATVERYVAARKAWRFLSVPTNTTQTVRQTWQEGASSVGSDPVPGFGTQVTSNRSSWASDGFDSYSAGGPSVKKYVPASNTFAGITTTSNTIKSTDGYFVFVRGDRTATSVSSTPSPTVLRTKGDLYTGDQTPIPVAAGLFTSIGNPYPSVIDMRNIVKTGVKDFFYLWDPALTTGSAYGYGAYQTFSNDGSGNYVITPGGGSYGPGGSMSNYIASGQAFFVQGDAGGGSLTFKEGAKTTGTGVSSVAAGLPTPQLRANLYGLNTDNSSFLTDGLLINYDDNYSNTVDDLDAIKQTNTSENLAVKTANKLLVVERRHTITTQDTIFLNLTGLRAQKYRFEFMAQQLYQQGLTAFLEDNYLHTSTPLTY